MKKLHFTIFASAICVWATAQVPRYDTGAINVNQVSALDTADGTQKLHK